jgi:CheY-like chemotaxis protein
MERLKAIPDLSTIPVIIVSGRDVHANHERALKAGARAFLQKPVENSELLRAIRVALGETVEVRQLPVLELEAESIPRSAHGGATR